MSDETNEVDDGADEGNVKGLRKQFKEALAQNKALTEELQAFRAEKRAEAVQSVFKAKGVPEGAAKFYTDSDVSETAVDKWLEENSFLLGAGAGTADGGKDESPEANSARRMADAAYAPPGTEALGDAAMAMGDPEELMKLINTAPDEELVKLGILRPSDGRYLKGGYVQPPATVSYNQYR